MIIISHYSCNLDIDGFITIRTNTQFQCPDCGGQLYQRDTKRRKVIQQDGIAQIYRLKRYKCRCCGKLHTVIPDCIIPYRHYAAEVMEGELCSARPDCPAANSTVHRWKSLFVKIITYMPKSAITVIQKTYHTKHWLSILLNFFTFFVKYTPSLRFSLRFIML